MTLRRPARPLVSSKGGGRFRSGGRGRGTKCGQPVQGSAPPVELEVGHIEEEVQFGVLV